MEAIASYINRHRHAGLYLRSFSVGGMTAYESKEGWVDYLIRPGLLFSHRSTHYTAATFRERLHTHDFFELVLYVEGRVRYLTDSNVLYPHIGDVIISPPGALHTAALCHPGDYTRYVLYMEPEAFGCHADTLLHFQQSGQFLRLQGKESTLLDALSRLRRICTEITATAAPLAYSHIIALLCRLQEESTHPEEFTALPQKALDIKSYIDNHIAEIGSVNDVATHFFYSREHMSRYFRRVFNIALTSYITARRIELAKLLLQKGGSVTDVCYDCGFANVSFFIKVFREKTGTTPYRYAKSQPQK